MLLYDTTTSDKVFYALAVGVVWLAKEMWMFIKKQHVPEIHKTFADDADKYWRQMREVVTQPLSEVLKTTNEILGELRDKSLRDEERQKFWGDQARRRKDL